jgi:hypothetical protein
VFIAATRLDDPRSAPVADSDPVGADLTQTAVATAAPPNVTLAAAPVSLCKPTWSRAMTLSSIAIKFDIRCGGLRNQSAAERI